MTFTRVETGSLDGDLMGFYESFFRGVILIDRRKNIADLRLVDPIYPQYDHYGFLVRHLRSLGLTIIEKDADPHGA